MTRCVASLDTKTQAQKQKYVQKACCLSLRKIPPLLKLLRLNRP